MRISKDAQTYGQHCDTSAPAEQHFQAGLNFAATREKQLARLAKNGRESGGLHVAVEALVLDESAT